jgi:cobaltochelatase CobT
MASEPSAFMSYVRSDDDHDGGRITKFRERLEGEVRMQAGKAFPIFQDRNDIAWGQPRVRPDSANEWPSHRLAD